jgi:hypothetical protein
MYKHKICVNNNKSSIGQSWVKIGSSMVNCVSTNSNKKYRHISALTLTIKLYQIVKYSTNIKNMNWLSVLIILKLIYDIRFICYYFVV